MEIGVSEAQTIKHQLNALLVDIATGQLEWVECPVVFFQRLIPGCGVDDGLLEAAQPGGLLP